MNPNRYEEMDQTAFNLCQKESLTDEEKEYLKDVAIIREFKSLRLYDSNTTAIHHVL